MTVDPLEPLAGPKIALVNSIGDLLLYKLDLGSDLDLFTDQNPPCFQGRVPVQAKIMSVDLPFDGQPGFFIAPWVFVAAPVFQIKGYFLGVAPDGEIALELILRIVFFLYPGTREKELLVIVRITKVGGF